MRTFKTQGMRGDREKRAISTVCCMAALAKQNLANARDRDNADGRDMEKWGRESTMQRQFGDTPGR